MSILFTDLNLLPQTEKALEELNFSIPTSVQAMAIPEMIQGHDIIVQSQTGTGKTFAFGIPTIEKIDPKLAKTQSLILCPTRELALQVSQEIKKLLKFHREIRTAVVYGGESYIKQFHQLDLKPQIIIATPGRMIDLLDRKKVDLSAVKILTLDEADEMLKMGFQDALETILSQIPKEKQTALFSATLPFSIKKIASKYQNNPKVLKVLQQNIAVKSIEQFYYIVKHFDKSKLLVRLLDQKNPESVIIFANTKKDVDNILSYLQERDFLADAIHGDLKQNQRQHVMNNFRKKNIKILVATDVAARGLDIDDIKMVINFDLPHEDEVYVHRIGRTGRAGKKGVAYSLISVQQVSQLKKLENYLKEKITAVTIPSIEEIKQEQNKLFETKIVELIEQNPEENNKTTTLTEALLEKFDDKTIINNLLSHLMPKSKKYEEIAEPKSFGGSSRYQNTRNNYRNNNFSRFNNSNSYGSDNRRENYGKRSNSNFSNNNNKFGRFGGRDQMTELTINLGREDGINPPVFLKILSDKFNVYGKNIGNIKHLSNKTVFEIADRFVKQVQSKDNVYYEKKLLQIQSI
ncbi:MAG: DEAD/DEAH box helicase [Candidatus Phytoplasma pruni]|nr:DEAD/DEAH box helicase [Candidatus Phytoplasma pruni]